MWNNRYNMTRLFVPFTRILPPTQMVLKPYRYEPVEMRDENSYLKYFQWRWHEGHPFLNCEHDSVFWHGAPEELMKCHEEWCAFGVNETDSFADGTTATLALMKFGDEFIEKYPTLWDEMKTADVCWQHLPTWQWCDLWLQHYMNEKGVVCHQHNPPIVNANPVKTAMVINSCEVL